MINAHAQKNIARLYVAPAGKETAPGSFERPVNNLTVAIRKAKSLVESTNADIDSVQIYLRKGIYHVSRTVELVEGKTWTSKVPLSISPFNNEKVVLHGGKVFTSGAVNKVTDTTFLKRVSTEMAAKIRQVNLGKAGINYPKKLRSTGFSQPYGAAPPELFLNGKPGRIARWPNNGYVLIDKLIDSGSIPRYGDTTQRGGKFTYAGTHRPSNWKEPEKAWLYGFFMWGYADEAVPLKSIDTITQTITTASPSMYGFGTGKPWRSWYAYNLPEEIDTTGEYYVDNDKKILYFLPPATLKNIDVSVLETPVIALEGVKNVWVKNITITCSRGMGIYLERTTGVRINGCTFSNLGMMAICMGKGLLPFAGQTHSGSGTPASRVVGSLVQHVYENSTYDREAGGDNGIINCEIFQTGAGGILLSGGNRLTLQQGNSFVENCRITDFNRLERTHRPAIWISGVGNRISNCEIFNAPSLAILLHGNDHLIEYNNIHHVALEVDDMSAIYYGRDPSEQGSVIRNNYFHHIGGTHKTMAVYHDDGACGMKVYNNVFYKAGTVAGFIGGGRDNEYTNNIFIDTRYAAHIDDRLNNWAKAMLDTNGLFKKRLNAVNFQQPPYAVQYPLLKEYFNDDPALPKRNIFSTNLLVNIKELVEGKPALLSFSADNLVMNTDPGFISYEKEDFRLSENSEVWKKMPAFKQIPFDKIGYHAAER